MKGEGLDLPHKCKFCNKSFTSDKIIPEKHNCKGLALWKKEHIKKVREGKAEIMYENTLISKQEKIKEVTSPSNDVKLDVSYLSDKPKDGDSDSIIHISKKIFYTLIILGIVSALALFFIFFRF